jgi:rubrerythrin
MSGTALGQVIRNAIEAEHAAARFYGTLAASTNGAEAAAFLAQMVGEEEAHAKAISEMGSRLEAGELPISADTNCALVETAPEWRDVEGIGIEAALEIACEAEIHAALYYDALADSVPAGPVREFFQTIARTEEAHVKRIEQQITARSRAARPRQPRRRR